MCRTFIWRTRLSLFHPLSECWEKCQKHLLIIGISLISFYGKTAMLIAIYHNDTWLVQFEWKFVFGQAENMCHIKKVNNFWVKYKSNRLVDSIHVLRILIYPEAHLYENNMIPYQQYKIVAKFLFWFIELQNEIPIFKLI